MPNRYQEALFSKLNTLVSTIAGMTGEPMTGEETAYFEQYHQYRGNSFSVLANQFRNIAQKSADLSSKNPQLRIRERYSYDPSAGTGVETHYLEEPELVREADDALAALISRCREAKNKTTAGPSLTALLNLTESIAAGMQQEQDVLKEMTEDPLYSFALNSVFHLVSPNPGAKNRSRTQGNIDLAAEQLPVYRMAEYGLDVRRKIRNFRDMINPLNPEDVETAKKDLRKTLDEYEAFANNLVENASLNDPLMKNLWKHVLPNGEQQNAILGENGYAATILPVIRAYKEGLDAGVDPALLPQYYQMKQALAQMDDAGKTLQGANAAGRYDKLLNASDAFRSAFRNLQDNNDPSTAPEKMQQLSAAMDLLSAEADAVLTAEKGNLSPAEKNALQSFRALNQGKISPDAPIQTFTNITAGVNSYYEKVTALRNAGKNSQERFLRENASQKALNDEQYLARTKAEKRAEFFRYNDRFLYNRKHPQVIPGGIFNGAFTDPRLFSKEYGRLYPRLARRFPELANPELAKPENEKQAASVFRDMAGQYLATMKDVLTDAGESLIRTRHFVKEGSLITDQAKIREMMKPESKDNPLYRYWQHWRAAEEQIKAASSPGEIKTAMETFNHYMSVEKNYDKKSGQADCAAAVETALDKWNGDLRAFAGPSDYALYFRDRLEVMGKHVIDSKEFSEALTRLCSMTTNLRDDGLKKKHLLPEQDIQAMNEMGEIFGQLANAANAMEAEEIQDGRHHYLPSSPDPDGTMVKKLLSAFDSLSPEAKDRFGTELLMRDHQISLNPNDKDTLKNKYFKEDKLKLASPENVDRFCKLALEAENAKSYFWDNREFTAYLTALQQVANHANTLRNNPNDTNARLDMAELMEAAGARAKDYLTAKGNKKRSMDYGNIRYNNAFAALYLTDPANAVEMAKNAKNLHISASQARDKKAREHLSLETLMQEEFGSLDRKYEKTRGPGGRYGFKEAEHKTNGKRK